MNALAAGLEQHTGLGNNPLEQNAKLLLQDLRNDFVHVERAAILEVSANKAQVHFAVQDDTGDYYVAVCHGPRGAYATEIYVTNQNEPTGEKFYLSNEDSRYLLGKFLSQVPGLKSQCGSFFDPTPAPQTRYKEYERNENGMLTAAQDFTTKIDAGSCYPKYEFELISIKEDGDTQRIFAVQVYGVDYTVKINQGDDFAVKVGTRDWGDTSAHVVEIDEESAFKIGRVLLDTTIGLGNVREWERSARDREKIQDSTGSNDGCLQISPSGVNVSNMSFFQMLARATGLAEQSLLASKSTADFIRRFENNDQVNLRLAPSQEFKTWGEPNLKIIGQAGNERFEIEFHQCNDDPRRDGLDNPAKVIFRLQDRKELSVIQGQAGFEDSCNFVCKLAMLMGEENSGAEQYASHSYKAWLSAWKAYREIH